MENVNLKQMLEEASTFVEDFAGFNFKEIGDGLATFVCMRGDGICTVPDEGDRWKHQKAILINPIPEQEYELNF